MGRLAAILIAVIVLVLLGVGVFNWWEGRQASHTVAKAQTQAGTATVSAGQARAEADATKIIVAGEARNHLDIQVHQDNAHALAQVQATGADQPLDPRLVDTANRGLCRYSANAADPGCARLLKADSAVLPPADPGGGPSPF